MRKFAAIALALLVITPAVAQTVRGPFSLANYLMDSSYLAKAGKTYIKADPPKPTTFQRADGTTLSQPLSDTPEFLYYLLDNGMAADALALLSEKPFHPSDTLDFLTGMTLFTDRQFLGARKYFGCCQGGAFAEPAFFYGNVSRAHLGENNNAMQALQCYTGPYRELAALQRAGFSLIEKDREGFDKALAQFTFGDYRLAEQERALKDISATVFKKGKSPLLAGALSAVVPGAGKVYAGRTGAGVATFLTVVPLAAVTADQWTRYGPSHWSTILAGSLFSLFYIGNIYGSYMSVSVQEQIMADNVQAVVMYNMHIPLRSFFR